MLGVRKTSRTEFIDLLFHEMLSREFPGGLLVRILGFHCPDSIPDWGTGVPQAVWCGKNK